MTARRTKIFFDGGCRPIPGPIEVAVVAGGGAMIGRSFGEGGSIDAVWLVLIGGLRVAGERGIDDFVLLGDSASVVAQALGRAPARGAAAAHLAAFRDLAGTGPAPRVRHIGRAQNLAGIALAKLHPC